MDVSQFTNLTLEQLRDKQHRHGKSRHSSRDKANEELPVYESHLKALPQVTTDILEKRLLNLFQARAAKNGYVWHWTPENKKVVRVLFDYFTGQPGCLSRDKGIYLYGPSGTGKSEIMNVFSRFSYEIASLAAQERLSNLYPPLQHIHASIVFPAVCDKAEAEKDLTIFHELGCYQEYPITLQDIFAERIINHFGKPTNILESIIHARADRHYITHATSNVKPEMFESEFFKSRYRASSISRFYNWHFIELTGQDWRKK